MAIVKLGNGSKVVSVDQIMNDFFNPVFGDNFLTNRLVSKVPAVNMYENLDSFFVEMAAPGLNKEDFKIQLEGEVLTISAEKKAETLDENKKYSRREYSFHSFSKSFNLPEAVDSQNVVANYENGILTIEVAKKDEVKASSRIIEIV